MNAHSEGNGSTYTSEPEVRTESTFDVISPATQEKLWSSSSVSAQQAFEAIDAALTALKTWRYTKPAEIRKILLKAADIMEAGQEELAGYMKSETGALAGFTEFDISTTVENLRDVAGRPANILGEIPKVSAPGQGAFLFKEPYGVIFAAAPWNAPYILGTRAFLYALAAGNTVILKGSELSPRAFWAIGSVMKEAGLPDGVLSVIYHRPEDALGVTNAMIESPHVKKVNFTGSTAVGAIYASKAGKELEPVLMELGGKASAIVCEDAEIKTAAMQCAMGSFIHAGQVCMATERILVNRKIIDQFAKALKGATEKVYASNGEAPILVAKATVEKNHKLLLDAISKGGKVIMGDLDAQEDSAYRMRPIIISDVKKGMDLYYAESFGPSVSLIAVDNDDEAIEIANETEYGLSGAIFTSDLGRGLKIAKQIDTGAVHINSMSIHDEALLPHGGVKKSGRGRFNAIVPSSHEEDNAIKGSLLWNEKV
ncbi:hypothetical protein LTR49_027728 [Elasticomyces elasticus]|nr:hypothetical protein LTR49_027728 [Elasticomyces elasticus]